MMKKYNFNQFNDEINEFYQLYSDKCSNEDFVKIFQPILTTRKNKRPSLILCTICAGICSLYILLSSERVSWHTAAVSRIVLIKLLPYWNWIEWKNEKCLISKQWNNDFEGYTTFNCDVCESVTSVDFIDDFIDEDTLKTHYLDVDQPLMFKLPNSWPKSAQFLLDAHNDIVENSIPCALATNTQRRRDRTLSELFATCAKFHRFFLHFQNCEFEAVKQFRAWFPRPKQLPVDLSPVQYNWLLWSRNYNATNYKRIDLIEKYTFFGQIHGKNVVRLVPTAECQTKCQQIDLVLSQGEGVLFTSLWNLEYLPYRQDNGEQENLAAILEMH